MRELIKQRADILKLIRNYLDGKNYCEVDTPQRIRTPGTDVNIEAFQSEDRYLITSPEFHIKRLLAEGAERIYQICHCFRKGEETDLHNSEFSMLEFYAVEMNLSGMMDEVENLIKSVTAGMGKESVSYYGKGCQLLGPWERLSVDEAFRKYAGWSPISSFNEDRFYYDLVDKVELNLGIERPTILYHYPPELAMLSKLTKDEPPVALRFELYLSGVEIANAFEELNDSTEQRMRFERDIDKRKILNRQDYPLDVLLLEVLDKMPDCCGIAVGIDRLIMLLLGGGSIDDVLLFPDEIV